ncbi:MAG: hypothetical protein M1360_01945 [Candidatus Marsarchaeota archaeon]|nr:hypothetical protein [Candidatus Marsarchaeota archaeon]MCL5418683.1 hypothetical protein [Candidatus Marsarchaeota archaeon]
MKTKFRYVLVRSTTSLGTIDEHEFSKGLMHYIGATNYFKANPRVVKNIDGNSFIMKVSLSGYSALIVALALMKHVSGKECGFFTIYASGTLKALGKHIGTPGTETHSKSSNDVDNFANNNNI